VPPLDTLTGILERLTYHNEENGYTVGRLAVEGARDLITIVGNFSNPVVGEQLFLEGRWTARCTLTPRFNTRTGYARYGSVSSLFSS
jgi:exodeoxyribonuclease V alpha subunit